MLQKRLKGVLAIAVLATLLFACKQPMAEAEEETGTQGMAYDSVLANKLGADDYGMSKYVMAFLKRGPNRSEDPAIRDSLQREHLKNIEKLAEEGKLVLAGPFMDDGDIRGIYIFAVESVEEAQKLTETDPAIQAGSLVMELHPWYGSAAVKEINNIHAQIQKVGIVE